MKNGVCHAYYFQGEPARLRYCYHSAFTRESCPPTGIPVRPEHVASLIGWSTTTSTASPTTARNMGDFAAFMIRAQLGINYVPPAASEGSTTTVAPTSTVSSTTTRNMRDFAAFIIRAQLGINYVPPAAPEGTSTTQAPGRPMQNIDPAWIIRAQLGIDFNPHEEAVGSTTAAPTTRGERTTRRTRATPAVGTRLPLEYLDATPSPISEETDLNLDLVPEQEVLASVARSIIHGFVDPSGDASWAADLAPSIRALFRGDFRFDATLIGAIHAFREVRGHVLLQAALRDEGNHQDELVHQALVLSLRFEEIHEAIKEQRERFAIGSGISSFCELGSEKIKEVIKADFKKQWSGRMINPPAGMLPVAMLTSYAANLPLYCPGLVGDDLELKSIILQHRIYRNGLTLIGRRHIGRLSINVPRGTPFTSCVGQLSSASIETLRQPIQGVLFIGEDARGSGLIREWFSIATQEIFSPESGFFKVDGNGIYHIVPSPADSNALDTFKAIGIFLGLSLVHGQSLGIAFPISYYAQMLALHLELDDIAEEEPELVRSLRILQEASAEDLHMYPIELDGEVLEVTTRNREFVISRKVNTLVPPDVGSHLDSLIDGFGLTVDDVVIDKFISPRNMRDIIYGNPHIDVEDMISSMVLNGHLPTDPHIIWFFKYLRAMNQQKLKVFLRFITGSSVAPLGGFGTLSPNMQIATDTDSRRLPRTRTCFNQLFLPRYVSEEQLIAKFDLALDNNGQMEEERRS